MKILHFIATFLLLCFARPALAAAKTDTIRITCQPRIGGTPVVAGTQRQYHRKSGDSLTIETLRFYISAISFYQKDKPVWSETYSYHLMDASDSSSLRLALAVPAGMAYDELRFTLGIDSLTNAKGIGTGALDPAKGMYWAWQSGYINFKLEGSSPLCATRRHMFQYHLGGFLHGFASSRPVRVPVAAGNILVYMDLGPLLDSLDLAGIPAIMIPGREAVELSDKMTTLFFSGK